MSRVLLFLALTLPMALAPACRRGDPTPMTPKEGELPPLPPASGTAVGYLVDNAATLKLRDDQLVKLKQLDNSLSARNDSIDTQLRVIERPDEAPPPQKGQPPARHNNAPGAQVKTTRDSAKLHQAKAENDREALAKAFAVLDDEQKPVARRLLDERGIASPDPGRGAGSARTAPAAGESGSSEQPAPASEVEGVPHEP